MICVGRTSPSVSMTVPPALRVSSSPSSAGLSRVGANTTTLVSDDAAASAAAYASCLRKYLPVSSSSSASR